MACCVWLEFGWTRRACTQDALNATLNSNSGRGSVTRIEINGLRLVPPLGNLLLLGHVCLACVSTVSIKSTGDQQLHEEAQAQHRPAHGRQEMLKAGGRVRRQSAKPEQPAEHRGDEQNVFKLISSSPWRHVSTRPGRHQRAQVTGALTSMLPLAISRSTEII